MCAGGAEPISPPSPRKRWRGRGFCRRAQNSIRCLRRRARGLHLYGRALFRPDRLPAACWRRAKRSSGMPAPSYGLIRGGRLPLPRAHAGRPRRRRHGARTCTTGNARAHPGRGVARASASGTARARPRVRPRTCPSAARSCAAGSRLPRQPRRRPRRIRRGAARSCSTRCHTGSRQHGARPGNGSARNRSRTRCLPPRHRPAWQNRRVRRLYRRRPR